MHVYSLSLELDLPTSSLKGKRGIVKSILARARNRFNVACAEVARQDDCRSAIIAFVTVSASKDYARGLLEQIEDWLFEGWPDVALIHGEIEER